MCSLIARLANSSIELLILLKRLLLNTLKLSKNLSELLSEGERNKTPCSLSTDSILCQLAGYFIFTPKVELFSYVKKELPLEFVIPILISNESIIFCIVG